MTEPSPASSLATAIDRVEERMALTELKQETQQDGAVKPTEASWQLQASPRSDRGSILTTTVLRDYRYGFKGTFAKAVNHLGGRRLFGWFLRSALAAIEKTADADVAINPGTPTP